MPYQIEANGLTFSAPWSPHEWAMLGKQVGLEFREALYHATSYGWILGDWLLEGERHGALAPARPPATGGVLVKGQGRHGRYVNAAKLTGCTESQLSNFYNTAKAFPKASRVAGLSFTRHHQALVFKAPAIRAAFLERALHEGWSAKRFRQAINARELPPAVLEGLPKARPTVPGRATKGQTTNQVIHGIDCPHCGKFIDRATIRTIRKRGTHASDAPPPGPGDDNPPG
jgi:hypothetical protein